MHIYPSTFLYFVDEKKHVVKKAYKRSICLRYLLQVLFLRSVRIKFNERTE